MRRAELLLGAAEVVEQLLVGGGLLERVELAAVEVLEQGVAQEVVLLGHLDDGRDDVLAGGPRGAPAALAHDQLVAHLAVLGALGHPADDDRLEHADLADRVHQLGQLVLVEDGARLAGVGPDLVERDLGELRAGHRAQLRPVVAVTGSVEPVEGRRAGR